jgi:hypothetical protein
MNDGGLLLDEEKEYKRFYKFSLWWVNHRALLRRIGLGIFIAFDALLLLWGGWHLLDAFAISYSADQISVAQMAVVGQSDLHAYTHASAAEDYIEEDVTVISIGSDRYDFFTTLQNPNEDWWATFTYAFEVGDDRTDPVDSYVLPSGVAYLTELGVDSSVPIRNADLVIEDLRWRRLDHHLISDYDTWYEDRMNFVIENVAYETEDEFDETFGRTSFTIENDTAFGYYDVSLLVLLKRGSGVVGVNKTLLTDLESGEEAEVDLSWFGTLPSVSQVEVIPILPLFDIDTYKPAEGESSIDTRTRVFR